MKQVTCHHCGNVYPDFDVAHVCYPFAPLKLAAAKFEPKMNPQIQELYNQVVGGDKLNFDSYLAAKFAELIVQECAKVADIADKNKCEWIGGNILTHFGIKDKSIKVGSRVKVIAGFNIGAKGTVSYIEPTGKLWVKRDRAAGDVFYHLDEIIGIEL